MKERVLEAYPFHGQYWSKVFNVPEEQNLAELINIAEPLNNSSKIHSDDDSIC